MAIKNRHKRLTLAATWWRRVDSNHRSETQQIYSLPPLATRELLHIQFLSSAAGSGPKSKPSEAGSIWKGDTAKETIQSLCRCGAGGRIRTPDLLITNQLLYRLSYTSAWRLSNSERYYNKERKVCQVENKKFFHPSGGTGHRGDFAWADQGRFP